MMEVLTLVQTQKLAKRMALVVYGSAYWNEVINFPALVKHGMISAEDLNLFQFADDPQTAFELLKPGLAEYAAQSDTMEMPAFAKSRNPQRPAGTT
jgi:predicted Rossmann-fold nucleotide-binding protein